MLGFERGIGTNVFHCEEQPLLFNPQNNIYGLRIFTGRRTTMTSEHLNDIMTVHADALKNGKHSTALFDDEKEGSRFLPLNSQRL